MKELRKKERVPQRVFADMLGIPLASYKTYEQGKIKLPERHWEKIYYLYKESVDYLKIDEMDKFRSICSNLNMRKHKF